MAYYCLHKFHWKPTEYLNMTREERAFVVASIQIRLDAEQKEQKRLAAKKPRKR